MYSTYIGSEGFITCVSDNVSVNNNSSRNVLHTCHICRVYCLCKREYVTANDYSVRNVLTLYHICSVSHRCELEYMTVNDYYMGGGVFHRFHIFRVFHLCE